MTAVQLMVAGVVLAVLGLLAELIMDDANEYRVLSVVLLVVAGVVVFVLGACRRLVRS